MSVPRHRQESFPQGDTWIIVGRLFGRDGNPLPLSGGVFLEWALIDDARTGYPLIRHPLEGTRTHDLFDRLIRIGRRQSLRHDAQRR